MIELKTILFYYLASIPSFIAFGIIWAAGMKMRGELVEIRHGVLTWVVIQTVIFATFALGNFSIGHLFKWLGV